MLKRSHVGLTLTLAAALGLAACGSKSTGPSFNGTISNADAADLGTTAASDFGGSLANVFDFGGPAIGLSPKASPRAVALLNQAWLNVGGRTPRYTVRGQMAAPVLEMSSSSGCNGGNYITSSGDSTDADGDGIYANYTVTIACDTVVNGRTIHYAGSEHIQDNPGLYGFTFTVDIVEEVDSAGGNSTRISLSGSETASFQASSAHDQLNFTEGITQTVSGNPSGFGIHEDWDATFTPTSASLALGSPLPDGHIAFTGGFYVTNPADATQNFNFTLQTGPALSYKAACAGNDPPYDGGVLKGFLNGNTSVGFTATFTACSTAPTVVGTGNSV